MFYASIGSYVSNWEKMILFTESIFCIHYLFATFLLSVNQALVWQRLMLKKVAFFRILAHINVRTHKQTSFRRIILERTNPTTYTWWCVTGKGMDDFSLPVNSSNVNFYLVNHGLSKKGLRLVRWWNSFYKLEKLEIWWHSEICWHKWIKAFEFPF